MKDKYDIFKEYSIYKNKRVLVTGHTGFKGSWLTLFLKELGAEVIGYSLDPVNPRDSFNLMIDPNEMVDIRGDIRSGSSLLKAFTLYEPQIVFHLAAQPLVRASYEDPSHTYEVNVMGTLNILEAFNLCPSTRAAVIITSDKCYKNNEWIYGYREEDPLGGYDPYSSSKACCEILVDSYRSSFLNPKYYQKHHKLIATARAGNVIGGGDWAQDRIIPDCIRALEMNHPIVLRNPKAVRPWQHVLEPLSGYLKLGARLLEGKVEFASGWNFGPKSESIVSVEDVVKQVIRCYGKGEYRYSSITDATLHEAGFLSLDISKAHHLLHWQPRWDLNKAIEETIAWYKSAHLEDIKNLSIDTIYRYMQQAFQTP